MKKTLAIFFAMSVILCCGISAGAVDIQIDGVTLETEDSAVNVDSRVLVPLRAVFESMGARVNWDDNAKTAWIARDGQYITVDTRSSQISEGVLNSDNQIYWVESKNLDVGARIINDRVYIPVRAVSETLGANVGWDGENNCVLIDTRMDEEGKIYYASDADYSKLYSVNKNGTERHKISDRKVKNLEDYGGKVYYLDKDRGYLCRADEDGEEVLLVKTIHKMEIDDGWLYYQELDGGGERSGIVYRINVDSGEVQQITNNHVKYAEKYGDYIYYNEDGDNKLYTVLKDGSNSFIIDTGDSVYSKLYPFNCIFYGDYILIEDGVWFGNLMRCRLDGTDMIPLTRLNTIVEKNQEHNEWVIYKQPDKGQDIYAVRIDGTDNHLVHKGDPLWLDITLLAQSGDMVYYKHPMRNEVYRASIDGSIDEYVGYADSIQIHDDRMFISYHGLYRGNTDGSGMLKLYPDDINGFAVIGLRAYLKDGMTNRLYITDFDGRGGFITPEGVSSWAIVNP